MNDIITIEAPTESSALATIQPTNLVAAFQKPGGIEAMVASVEAEARKQVADLDVSTEKNRKAMASLAYKVARSKEAIDKAGKDLNTDAQRQINAVNEDRRIARERLEALKEEIRAPLNEYEAREASRVAGHEAALAEIEVLANIDGLTAEQITERIWSVPSVDARPWHEFQVRAVKVIGNTLDRLNASHTDAAAREAEAAELVRLRAEEAERQRLAAIEAQRQREERIAAEAAAEAKRRAEAEAARQAQEAAAAAQRAQEAIEAAARAERQAAERREKEAAEALARQQREAREAEERAAAALARAEADAKAALEQAERDRLAAIERQRIADERVEINRKAEIENAKRREAEAVAAERRRIEAEQAEKQRQDDIRAANVAHQRKINREAVAGLTGIEWTQNGIGEKLSEELAQTIVKWIALGKIPHISVRYEECRSWNSTTSPPA